MMKRLNYRDLFGLFGDPATQEGKDKIKNSLVTIISPFDLSNGQNKILCHDYIAGSYISALNDILNYYGEQFIIDNGLNEFNGCFCHRKISGAGDWWSIHSWGLAVDHMASRGPYGKPPLLPMHFVEAFIDNGFGWGGRWKIPDGMHFSVTGG